MATSILNDIIDNFKATNGLNDGGTEIDAVLDMVDDIPVADEMKCWIDELHQLDTEMDTLSEAIKDRKRRIDELEYKLKSFLEENNLESSKAYGVTFSLKQNVGFKVQDWDEAFDWAFTTGNKHVLYHQLKSTALQELMDHGELPEFIEPSTYTKLSRRG